MSCLSWSSRGPLVPAVAESLRVWNPELNRCSCAGFSFDATPAPSELRPLLDRCEPDMARKVKRLGDDESGPVVGHCDTDAPIDHLGGDPNTRGVRMLLDVRERLSNVLEHGRRDFGREVPVKLNVDI